MLTGDNPLVDHDQSEYHKEIQASFRANCSTMLVFRRYDH